MKKVCKKLMTIVMATVMLLMTATPAFAGSNIGLYISKNMTMTLYSKQSVKNNPYANTSYIAYIENAKVSVKSSNPKVATVKVKSKNIVVTAKKTGKVTITIKKGSKNYRCKVTVSKYANPISSVKVGKTTISGKKFNTNNYMNFKYSKYAGKKTAVKIKMKKGWKLLSMDYAQKTWRKGENIKNGSKVPVKGGSGFTVGAYVMNTATQQTEIISLQFK